jgi:hypothetical protein
MQSTGGEKRKLDTMLGAKLDPQDDPALAWLYAAAAANAAAIKQQAAAHAAAEAQRAARGEAERQVAEAIRARFAREFLEDERKKAVRKAAVI